MSFYLIKTDILLYIKLFFRIFLPFFRERKKKDAPERRKKDRGRFWAARRKHARISRLAVFRTWNTAELLPQLPKSLNQAKNGTNIPKMRVFYEHFCRNDRTNNILHHKNASRVMRAFFSVWSHLFLFLSFGIRRMLTSFRFLQKEKERNRHKKINLKQNIRLKPN